MNGQEQSTTGGLAVTSAAAVANEFLALGRAEPSVPPIDQMKLQKLIYYAHAWHLAIYGKPLFEEDVEAWPWGPVVRDVYIQTKAFGRRPVTCELVRPERSDRGFRSVSPHIDDDELKSFIKDVWDVHKNFTGIQLSNATHSAGEPWTIIRDLYGDLNGKPTIPNEIIMDVFKSKTEKRSHADSAA